MVVLRQGKDREPRGDILFQPVGQLGRAVAVTGDQLGQRGFGLGEILCRPDRFQLLADALADLGVGGVVDGVLGQMELAALPCSTAENGAPGSAQATVVVGDDELDAAQPAGDEAFED